MLDLENVGLAVEISFLSHLQAEIKVFPVLEAAILDFPLPVRSYIVISLFIGLLDRENMGVAVGISLLSRLQVEI